MAWDLHATWRASAILTALQGTWDKAEVSIRMTWKHKLHPSKQKTQKMNLQTPLLTLGKAVTTRTKHHASAVYMLPTAFFVNE